MRFDVITIFPEIFKSYLEEGLIARAQRKKLLEIRIHNLRRWTTDAHRTVDDRPFGGGRGMVMKIEPIYKAVGDLKRKNGKSKIVIFTPRGERFNQKIATEFSKLGQLILICGRYEGVDERVAKYIADKKISIGSYVLMGGELAALVVVETVARLVPGVIGKSELLKKRITKKKGFLEYPQYTRPEIFSPKKGVAWRVPKILLSGDHKKIEAWREKHSKIVE
ncbi:tRNA (guanosine(37)-N1)-methyltransferase TrmD [bacterium]|nr:tRNA (guanosine(37)-N1)-methyltransferase TrmD [bacterium]